MAPRRKAKATFIACMFLVFAFQEMGEAAEWSTSPSVRVRRDYDDNIQLSIKPLASVTSTWVVPKLDFGIASDIWKVYGGAELAARRFSGHSELDSDSQSYTLGYSYMTERSILQLNAASSKIAYLAGPKTGPDIGLFTQNTSTDTKVFSPSWTWSMTERTHLQLTYSKSDVSYVNGGSTGLFDYGYSSLSVKLSNQIDIDTQIFLLPVYSIYRVPANATESKTTSYQVGITRTFSETMNGTLSLGGRNTSGETQLLVCKLSFGPICLQTALETVSSRDSSRIYNANLEKQFQTVHLTAAAGRSFDPSGNGQQVIADFVSLSLSRPFTEKLTGYLTTDGYNYHYRISSQTGGVSSANNDYRLYHIGPYLRWQTAPEWNLEGGYRYTYIRRESETTAATSNMVYLTLAYQWPKISISR